MRCGKHGDGEQHQRQTLENDAVTHHPVAVFRIEVAATGHGKQTDEQRTDDGYHRQDRENGKESAHDHDIAVRRHSAQGDSEMPGLTSSYVTVRRCTSSNDTIGWGMAGRGSAG